MIKTIMTKPQVITQQRIKKDKIILIKTFILQYAMKNYSADN